MLGTTKTWHHIRLLTMLLLFCSLLCACAENPVSENPAAENPAAESQVTDELARAEYKDALFDTSVVHQVDISIPEEDWADLLEHAVDRTQYKVDITIDGEEVKDVAFSTKGNSSLYFVADDPEAVRFSFKVNFGEYVEGQTYHGLDSLNLNNGFCDATYMKDYVSYELFKKTGVPAPLGSYVWLTVNGKDHGLYFAVERVGESFLNREFGGKGVIYEPESESLGLTLDQVADIRKNGLPMTTADSHGADLAYTDNNPESYPDIFENAVTASTDKDDQDVIAALRSLSEGKDIEKHLDTDEIIRYFAVHNFVLNYDSYTGSMLHNLVLYENEGVLGLLPWDYNLAYGTFTPGTGKEVLKDATDLVNMGIDTPLIGASEDERPMWEWIVNDEGYLEKYHDVLDSLISDCFESGEFDREFDSLYEMLLPYVEKDPSALYSVEEYKNGCEVLRQLCNRRAESIREQLAGKLSAVSEEQSDREQVNASDLSVMDMGAFDVGEDE